MAIIISEVAEKHLTANKAEKYLWPDKGHGSEELYYVIKHNPDIRRYFNPYQDWFHPKESMDKKVYCCNRNGSDPNLIQDFRYIPEHHCMVIESYRGEHFIHFDQDIWFEYGGIIFRRQEGTGKINTINGLVYEGEQMMVEEEYELQLEDERWDSDDDYYSDYDSKHDSYCDADN